MSTLSSLRASSFRLAALAATLSAASIVLAQSSVITSDSLTPFQPRDVGAVSSVKTVRVRLNQPLAIRSIAIASGFTEFTAGAVSGCSTDGITLNPAFTVCEVPVTFAPKYPGLRTAPLLVTDSTGTKHSLGLVGTSLAPRIALTPGVVSVTAGTGKSGAPGDGGPAVDASLVIPEKVVIDAAGNLYFIDAKLIRKIDTQGIITTVAGSRNGSVGDGVPATQVVLWNPMGIALDAAGNLYIADAQDETIRKVDVNGIITTVAGQHLQAGHQGDGGPATAAGLYNPEDVTVDAAGNLYIVDTFSNRIRKIDTSGIITTIAGTGHESFGGDGGPATSAFFDSPAGIAVDPAGNLYIADLYNYRVRKIDTNGIITTIAGTGPHGESTTRTPCGGDGGPAIHAGMGRVSTVFTDAAGNVYANGDCDAVRRIDAHGTIRSFTTGYARGAALDGSGNLYFSNNNQIKKIDANHAAVSFASQNAGTTSAPQTVYVTNTGNQHANLLNPATSGDFDLLSGATPDCSQQPALGAGFSCVLRLTFTPTDAGPFTGTATLTTNSLNQPGTVHSVDLSGTGVQP